MNAMASPLSSSGSKALPGKDTLGGRGREQDGSTPIVLSAAPQGFRLLSVQH